MPLAHEHYLGHIADSGDPGIADQLRVECYELRKDRKELLLRGTATRFKITPESVDGSCRYVPSSSAGLICHLPSRPAPYKSTSDLFAAVRDFMVAQIAADEHDADLLAFIAFSSFFCDCLSTSPCLLLF
jgi:hypothetical protein